MWCDCDGGRQVVEEADKTLSWLQQKQDLQAQTKKHDDPVLLSADIKKKEDTLRRVAEPILNKPAPAPKVGSTAREQSARCEGALPSLHYTVLLITTSKICKYQGVKLP